MLTVRSVSTPSMAPVYGSRKWLMSSPTLIVLPGARVPVVTRLGSSIATS